MVRPGQERGDLLGVVGERAGKQHLAAVQDEPDRLPPGGAQVQQELIAKLKEPDAVLKVPADEITASSHEAQLCL